MKRNSLNCKKVEKFIIIIIQTFVFNHIFLEDYELGPHNKWYIDPENKNLEGSSTILEKMKWKFFEDVEICHVF